MAKKYQNKQEALRIRVYNFYNDHKSKGKMFTVNHFKLEKVPERTIYGIIQRAENNITAKRKHGSGRIAKKMNKRALNRLKKAIDHSDKLSQRQAGRQFNITHSYVNQLCKKHQISARKKMGIPNRTEQQKAVNRAKCGNLYLKNPGISWILDDESYFTLSHSTHNGNDYFYSSDVSATPASVKYRPKSKYEAKVLVWICMSEKGVSAPIFIESGNAVDQFTYLKFIKCALIPFIKKHHSDGNYKFWPDQAGAHYSGTVVNHLVKEKINFIELTLLKTFGQF